MALHGDFHRGETIVFHFPRYTKFCINIQLLSQILNVYDFQDVAKEIALELKAKPDLIIGNYSEGNLVASLLANKLGVTQV